MPDASPAEDLSDGLDGGAEAAPRATIEDLFADLTDLADDPYDEVLDIKQLLVEAHDRGLIDSGVRDLRASDAAQAFVGSVIFASPLLVEDGIFDIADHLFGVTWHDIPIFLIANTVFVVFVTYALLEWTGRNTDEKHVLFGLVPLRLFMILAISFVVATILMTVWGRIGDWQQPTEALARINVIWTVGSLGAALGDILSGSDADPVATPAVTADGRQLQSTGPAAPVGDEQATSVEELTDTALVAALHAQFDDLESAVDSRLDRQEVNRIREQTVEATLDDVFGDKIQKYTSRDIAEAFVGSIFFAIPLLVEDGVFDVAAYFLSFQVGYFPVFFLVNAAFVFLMILALVYWAGPQDVRISRPILGFIPRRLLGIALVSFLTVAALMTMWGRVGQWDDPVVALARISVVWTVASFGAALGDILPGESSGADLNDDLAALGESAGAGDEGS